MASNKELIEYRVRDVSRYIVTRYQTGPQGQPGIVSTIGEYASPDTAYEVGYALCKAEHDRLGWPIADERIQYPRHPRDPNAEPLRGPIGSGGIVESVEIMAAGQLA
jgi:hypothetical protein